MNYLIIIYIQKNLKISLLKQVYCLDILIINSKFGILFKQDIRHLKLKTLRYDFEHHYFNSDEIYPGTKVIDEKTGEEVVDNTLLRARVNLADGTLTNSDEINKNPSYYFGENFEKFLKLPIATQKEVLDANPEKFLEIEEQRKKKIPNDEID
jgi:hypothetical protein